MRFPILPCFQFSCANRFKWLLTRIYSCCRSCLQLLSREMYTLALLVHALHAGSQPVCILHFLREALAQPPVYFFKFLHNSSPDKHLLHYRPPSWSHKHFQLVAFCQETNKLLPSAALLLFDFVFESLLVLMASDFCPIALAIRYVRSLL